MGRVEEYLGDRLRGLEIPADLRRLVELELDGALNGDDWVQPFAEVHVLGPGELHGLQEPDLYAKRRRPSASGTALRLARAAATNCAASRTRPTRRCCTT
jgi:hypothetical protein